MRWTHATVVHLSVSYLEFCMSHCNERKHGVHRTFQSQTSLGRIIVAADEDGGLNQNFMSIARSM